MRSPEEWRDATALMCRVPTWYRVHLLVWVLGGIAFAFLSGIVVGTAFL